MALTTLTTARADGFYMPAEWSAHAGALMAFPTPQNWSDDVVHARADWTKIAQVIAEFEPVVMLANEGEGAIARAMLSAAIEVIEIPINDVWTRDTGPQFLVDGQGGLRAASFGFNGWGQKLPPWDADAALKGRLCAAMSVAEYVSALILEGGAITIDGAGTLIGAGMGLGGRVTFGDRVFVDIDTLAYAVQQRDEIGRNTSPDAMLVQRLMLGVRLFSRLALVGGVSYSLLWSDEGAPDYGSFGTQTLDEPVGGRSLSGWPNVVLGLQVL